MDAPYRSVDNGGNEEVVRISRPADALDAAGMLPLHLLRLPSRLDQAR